MTDRQTIMIAPNVGFYVGELNGDPKHLVAYDYATGQPIFVLNHWMIHFIEDGEVRKYGYLDQDGPKLFLLKRCPLMTRIPIEVQSLAEAFESVVKVHLMVRNVISKV